MKRIGGFLSANPLHPCPISKKNAAGKMACGVATGEGKWAFVTTANRAASALSLQNGRFRRVPYLLIALPALCHHTRPLL